MSIFTIKVVGENDFGKGRISLIINAFDSKTDEKIAEAVFAWNKESSEIRPGNVLVSSPYRRKGIATAMYQLAEQHTGLKLLPSKDQSSDAVNFWIFYSKISN